MSKDKEIMSQAEARLFVWVSKDVKKKVRLAAIEKGVTMQQYIEGILIKACGGVK